ncbi:MAG: glycosyltransferase family 2 protein [Elusimicrobia bacterium]|nr:glycosyltransferase family 2 protein [Elusimicrobiota bacterium]
MSAAEAGGTLSIVLPVYNEKATFPVLMEKVLSAPLPPGLGREVVIVEGNSTDGTRDEVRRWEGRPGVKIVWEDAPRGKGAAVRRGLAEISGDYVLIQDGDLEYDVADYPRLLEPLLAGECDVVLGSRVMRSPQHWQFRRFSGFERFYGFFVNFGGVLFTALFNLLYGQRLTDVATMFKIFRASDLEGMTFRSDYFDLDWELAAKLAKKGLRFGERSVTYRARSRAEGKKIRFWRDGTRVLLAILRYRVSD